MEALTGNNWCLSLNDSDSHMYCFIAVMRYHCFIISHLKGIYGED